MTNEIAQFNAIMQAVAEQIARDQPVAPLRHVSPHRAARQFLARGWKSTVYVIQAGADGPIKIGMTDDLDRRMAQLRGASPLPLRIRWLMRGGRRLELQLHRRFAASRLHGEWFRPSDDLTAWLEDAEAGIL